MENGWQLNRWIEKHNKEQDWISEMPDEILIMILSLLSLKEAVRTSAVSRKWRHLWKFYGGSMNFDGFERLMYIYNQNKDGEHEEDGFVEMVNQVLHSHQATRVEELRIVYPLGERYTKDINRWLEFAMANKVRRLELNFSLYIYYWRDFMMYNLSLQTQIWRFDTLISLTLKSVNLTEELVASFLSTCTLLEQLCVEDARDLLHLRIGGPRLKLKEVWIMKCENLKDLKISAPNLVSFTYHGPNVGLPLEDVPLISSASFGGGYCEHLFDHFYQLSFYPSRLEALVLDFNLASTYRWLFPKDMPEYSSLKLLELQFCVREEQCIIHLLSFLCAFPHLHKFVLKYNVAQYSSKFRHQCKDLFGFQKYPQHDCLKVVEFCGWTGMDSEVEFAMHLLDVANSLEKIVMDTRDPRYLRRPLDFIRIPRLEKMNFARERAQEFATKLPSGLDLVIL